MKIWSLLFAGLLAAPVHAEPVLFKDNKMILSEAIVLEGKQTRFYKDIHMGVNAQGDFRVISAAELPLAAVSRAEVVTLESFPVQIHLKVSGYKPTPCYELEEAVTRDGSTFHVVVGLKALQTLVACVQVIDPFTVTIPLDVKDLGPGRYEVMVNNDTQVSFQLN